MMNQAKDPMGTAINEFFKNPNKSKIVVSSPDVEDDIIPVEYLFRDFKDMPELEKEALQMSRGRILDVGAGAGSHSLYLQNKGYDVTAVDYSEKACTTMLDRGIHKVLNTDIYTLDNGERYDTILLLMNGIGLAAKLKNVHVFIHHLIGLLRPGGQIIFDSSDLCFLYQEEPERMMEEKYYGEINFTMKYKTVTGKPFDWLYIDFDTMQQCCIKHGWKLDLLAEGAHFDYLASIQLT